MEWGHLLCGLLCAFSDTGLRAFSDGCKGELQRRKDDRAVRAWGGDFRRKLYFSASAHGSNSALPGLLCMEEKESHREAYVRFHSDAHLLSGQLSGAWQCSKTGNL